MKRFGPSDESNFYNVCVITVEQMKKIDPDLADMSEIELEELRDALYESAQLAFDVYWAKKNGSKNPVGSLPTEGADSTL